MHASEGTPDEYLKVGELLTVAPYYNRVETLWYKANSHLVDTNQTELPPININEAGYVLTKTNWADGSKSQENCIN